jgi:sulfofructose kinase
MKYDLISLGLNAVDVLIRLPENIQHDGKQMVRDLIIQAGAPVGSGSAGVAMLGYKVAMVARLGKNSLSEISLEQFRRYGITTDLVIRDEESRPAIALVEIDPVTSARTVFIQMDDYGFIQPEDIPVDKIQSSRVLLVDSYDLDATEAALRAADGTPCRSVMDFESGDIDRLRQLISIGTDPILPLECARELTQMESPENVLLALASLCSGDTVITDGINGSWGFERQSGEILHQPVFPVESVDTTGCGDAYHAGSIVGILQGWSLRTRMEMGAFIASRVATRVGGRTALPIRSQVPSLLPVEISPDSYKLISEWSGTI